ncbi:putative toxin [Fontivita pretiosa]|uniref:putative toxin n=1 Tax=Fontivita pretiosa TaxID=2989684 RepID=UPI003D176A43
MIQNAAAGMKFQNEMRLLLREVEQLDVPAKKRFFDVVLATGRARRTFPDVVIAGQSMIEIKRVQSLQLTDQFRAQIQAAKEHGLNYRIIVSDTLVGDPHPDLTGLMRDLLLNRANGKTASIEKYDSIQRKLVKIWPLE